MNILGIGTDITEIVRIGRMIERHGELFLNRVYTENEIQYCQPVRNTCSTMRAVGSQGSCDEDTRNRLGPWHELAGH